MTLEGAEGRIWCSKIGWQTVPCSWSIDGEAPLTGSSPGTRDQQSPRCRGTQLLAPGYQIPHYCVTNQIRWIFYHPQGKAAKRVLLPQLVTSVLPNPPQPCDALVEMNWHTEAVATSVASFSSFARRSRSRKVISDIMSELAEPGSTGTLVRPPGVLVVPLAEMPLSSWD